MEIITKNAKETREFGEKIGSKLVGSVGDKERSRGNIFGLVGDLGSGKTTFVQGLARGLGIKQRIISPTFIIMRSYRIKVKAQKSKLKAKSNNSKYTNFYHVDLYRLEGNIEKEITNLGLKEIWSESENIVAIEWAEKVKKLIPKNAIWINFRNNGKGVRRIVVGDKYDNL